MNAVILDGREPGNCSDCSHAVDTALANILVTKREERRWFKLSEMNIQPCQSCGACAHKTPGECVFRDDMPQIMWQVAAAEVVVFVSPIRFGGYASQLKKVVDKLILMSLPFYFVKEGHLLHPMRYGRKGLLGIGLSQHDHVAGSEVEKAFSNLVAQNALNMQFYHETLIIPSSGCDDDLVTSKVAELLEQVRKGVDGDARS